jgi:hypothetical protein
LDRGGEQRLALPRWQACEFTQSVSGAGSPRDHLLQRLGRDRSDLEWQLARPTHRRPRGGVTEHTEQPTAQMPHLGACVDRRIGVQERLLNDVLRAAMVIEPPRRGEQLAAIALDDRGERPLVARARERDEMLIRVSAQRHHRQLEPC